MLSLALLSFATAADPSQSLMESLPGAALIMRCSSTQDFIDTWGGASFLDQIAETSDNKEMAEAVSLMMDKGLNVDAPVTMAVTGASRELMISFEVTGDSNEILTKLREEEPEPEFSIEVDGERVTLRGHMDDKGEDIPLGDGAMLPEVLGHVDFGEPGCWAAMDVVNEDGATPMASFRGGVLLQGFTEHPDRFRIAVTGLPAAFAVASEVLEGEDPWKAPMGSSELDPWLVARVNLDVERLIGLLANLPPGPRTQNLGEIAGELEDSGLRIAPGAELAMLNGGGGPTLAAVVPVKRPIFARAVPKRLAKRMAEDGLEVGREDGLTVITLEGGGSVYIAARRRRLVAANDPQVVQDILSGGGAPWIAADSDLGAEPGIYVDMNLKNNPLKDMVPGDIGGREDNPFDGVERMAFSMRAEDGAAIMYIEMPGFREVVREGILENLAEDEEEKAADLDAALGSPPSSEAAALLMLISSREEAAFAETGSYVAYAGGPRDLDQLNGDAVPWDGIPALGVEPMETPCRFEVSLNEDGYTGRAICDEDGDGVQAIYLVIAGDLPFRVTPADVR